jgi:hypothetical protein
MVAIAKVARIERRMGRNFQSARKAFLLARQGSRSLRFSGNPGKPLMRLILPALAAAGHCRLNSDRNDNARSLTRRVGISEDFCGIPGISDRGRSRASDADPLSMGLTREFGQLR